MKKLSSLLMAATALGARGVVRGTTKVSQDLRPPRKTSWRQTELAELKRSGPCPGNRQDAAGNHRRMRMSF